MFDTYPRYVNIFNARRVRRKVSEATCLTSRPKEDLSELPLETQDNESSLAARLLLF